MQLTKTLTSLNFSQGQYQLTDYHAISLGKRDTNTPNLQNKL